LWLFSYLYDILSLRDVLFVPRVLGATPCLSLLYEMFILSHKPYTTENKLSQTKE